MQFQSKTRSLRKGTVNRHNDIGQRSAVYQQKSLLKASTNLPVMPTQDELSGFVKGYN